VLIGEIEWRVAEERNSSAPRPSLRVVRCAGAGGGGPRLIQGGGASAIGARTGDTNASRSFTEGRKRAMGDSGASASGAAA